MGVYYEEDSGISIEKDNSIDVLFMGDSEAMAAFSPMEIWKEYGIASFNTGKEGQQLRESQDSLKQTLKYQTPKLIVLETNMIYREEGYLDSLEGGLSSTTEYYLPVVSYHNRWKQFAMEAFGHKSEGAEAKVLKGWHYSDKVDPYPGTIDLNNSGGYKTISKKNELFLNSIVDFAGKNDIPILLISAPSPTNWSYAYHNAIQDFADKKDIPFLDLNIKSEEIGIDWSEDTSDQGDHVNCYGAKKVSVFLGMYLKENYTLPDYRSDKDYDSWNQNIVLYEQDDP